MLCLFLSLARPISFLGSAVKRLTTSNFDRMITKRGKNEICLVMFHGQHCPACQGAYPKFISVANQMRGIASLAHVDCSDASQLCSQFGVYTIPAFVVFHPEGQSSLTSLFHFESTFINGIMKYVPVKPERVNATWLPGNGIEESAILFTGKWSLPFYWQAIATNFSGAPVHIGFVNDRKTKKLFNCTADTLKIIKGKEVIDYEVSEPTFLELYEKIRENFRDLLSKKAGGPRKNAGESEL